MLQIIFMVIGVYYLFRLLTMNPMTGARPGLLGPALVEWQRTKRREYIAMIIAGWGSFAVNIAVDVALAPSGGFAADSDAMSVMLLSLVAGLIVLVAGGVVSYRAHQKCKDLELRATVAAMNAAPWRPTHRVPAQGLAAYDYPDGSRMPVATLPANAEVTVGQVAGDWALAQTSTGWAGWVDNRQLAPIDSGTAWRGDPSVA